MAEEKKQQVQVELDEKTAKGVYSNVAVIFHNQNEFVIDFAFLTPAKNMVVSRVITSPSHAKGFVKALKQNIEQYEKQFGEIKEAKGPDGMGIKLSNN